MAGYKLVIFDLDGTLLDTTEGVLNAVQYTISKCGLHRSVSDHSSDRRYRIRLVWHME